MAQVGIGRRRGNHRPTKQRLVVKSRTSLQVQLPLLSVRSQQLSLSAVAASLSCSERIPPWGFYGSMSRETRQQIPLSDHTLGHLNCCRCSSFTFSTGHYLGHTQDR